MEETKVVPKRRELSEDRLRRDFAKYQKLVEELSRRYAIEPVLTEESRRPQDEKYTAEATFIYEVHALA